MRYSLKFFSVTVLNPHPTFSFKEIMKMLKIPSVFTDIGEIPGIQILSELMKGKMPVNLSKALFPSLSSSDGCDRSVDNSEYP